MTITIGTAVGISMALIWLFGVAVGWLVCSVCRDAKDADKGANDDGEP